MKRIKIVLQFQGELFEKVFDSFMNRCVRERQNYSLAIAYKFHLLDENDENEIIRLLQEYNAKMILGYQDTKFYYVI